MRAVGRVVAAGCFAAAFATSGSALADEEDPWFGTDKWLHFGVSAALAGGGYAASTLVFDEPWQRAVSGASLSLTLGAAKEVYDLGGAGDPSYRDFVWDVAGSAVGVGVALVLDLALRKDPERVSSHDAALALTF